MITTLRTADTNDITTAAALLHGALLASATGRLMGSATTHGHTAFADVLTAGVCFGRVDLAVSGDRIDGVACWIHHPDGPIRPPTTARRSAVGDLVTRLHLIDLIVPVPERHSHQHLACLGTRPGYQARAITDLLLHRQKLFNDRRGHGLYTEVHDQAFRAWLLRSGYHDHGLSLSSDSSPQSYLVSYAGRPP